MFKVKLWIMVQFNIFDNPCVQDLAVATTEAQSPFPLG